MKMTDSIGPQRINDRRGWLIFDALPDDLQRAEDTTQAADHARLRDGMAEVFHRPATTTERTLLAHLRHTVPEDLQTRVAWIANGVRNRRWPTLEGT